MTWHIMQGKVLRQSACLEEDFGYGVRCCVVVCDTFVQPKSNSEQLHKRSLNSTISSVPNAAVSQNAINPQRQKSCLDHFDTICL